MAYKPEDKLVVTWTEVATERFETTCTAQELADLIDCEVAELAEILEDRPWDHDLANRLADWSEEPGTLSDFQREDICVKPKEESK